MAMFDMVCEQYCIYHVKDADLVIVVYHLEQDCRVSLHLQHFSII